MPDPRNIRSARSEAIASKISRRTRDVARVASKVTGDTASSLERQGRKMLRLYGAPDRPPPPHVLEAAAAAVHEGTVAPSMGLPGLRRAIAARLAQDNGIEADPDREILVTNAAMHALSIALTTLIDPGDEVLTTAPIFCFEGAIRLAGGVPVYAATSQERGWRWDLAALERAVTPRTKILLVNTPTNPTGYVATADDLEAVADIARRHDLVIVSDEAYSKMVYEGARHRSIAAIDAARDRTVSIFSCTKDYALKAWRIGFIVAPAPLTEQLVKVLEWNVLECNHVAQHAARAALEGPQGWVTDSAVRYQRCRDLMVDGLRAAPRLSFVVPQATPFLFMNVEALGITGEAFSHRLLHEYGVATDPGAPFGSASHVRLLFGGEDDVVREAARRISRAAEAH